MMREKSDQLFSPVQLIEQALQADLDFDPSRLIDDRDFPLAANVVEFLTDPRFLNWERPFPRQIQVAMHAFMDYCPLCSNPRYVDNLYDQDLDEIFDNIVFLRYGICPRCGMSRAHLVEAGLFKGWINEVVGVAGQRSSKSFTVAVLSLYLLHRYLKLPTAPYRFFGLAPTLLHLTFVALTYKQAEENLWDPFIECYSLSPWFQQYNEMLRQYEAKFGRKLVDVKTTYILYHHKNLTVYPSGPDKRKLRGRTRFGYAIDEFAYFDSAPDSKSVKFSAEEIYQALENSLATVRAAVADRRREGYYDIPDAYSFLISSPTSKNDRLMLMLREADRVKSRYAFHYATWEFNPKIKFEHLQEYFEKDPIKARRDFGADPPLNDTPLISNVSAIKRIFGKVKGGNLFRPRQVVSKQFCYVKATIRRRINRPVVIGIDAGLSFNSFALVVLSLSPKSFIFDGFLEVIPLRGTQVNFAKMQALIKRICEVLKPHVVVADRWNSIALLHELMEEELVDNALQRSPTYNQLRNFAGAIVGGTVRAPDLEDGVDFQKLMDADFEYPTFFLNRPVAHFAYQLLTVRDTGRRIDKGLNATDDLFRAAAIAYLEAVDLLESKDFSELFAGDDTPLVPRKTALGTVVPKSAFSATRGQSSVQPSTVVQTGNRPLGIVKTKTGR